MSSLRIYTTPQAAEYLGVSVATIKHYLYNERSLEADGRMGNYLYFTKSTLDRIKRKRAKAAAEAKRKKARKATRK